MSSRKKTKPLPATRRPAPRQPGQRTIGWPLIAGGIAVVIGVVSMGILLAIAFSGDDGPSSDELTTRIDASAASLPQQDGFAIGRADAPLVLEVYEDFQCPFCVEFTGDIEPMLLEEYVAAGKLRLVFQNFPILGSESAAAAEASVCAAEQNRAWNFILTLYSIQASADQHNVERLNVGRFDTPGLRDAAGQARLNLEAFDACLQAGGATETVASQHADGVAAGVRGTPSFVLNGSFVSNVPSDQAGWREFLDGRLALLTN